MLDCGNANNSNVAPVVPKKGPVWDDRFLLADCNYANAQLGADELVTQIDNNKAIFTPPPSNKLTCIVKLSELKNQLGSAINSFVCPDGGLITLADADEIAFYTYDKSLYPNGSILGVKKGNKNYIARLFKSGGGLNFTGFVDYDIWKANGHPPNTSFHSAAPTLKQDLQVWAIEQSEDQQVRNIGLATYSTSYYKQGEINTGSGNRLNYALTLTASSCNFINNAKDATPKDGYSSQAGLEDLKTKLNTYEDLGDVVFKVTDKAGKTSYVTKSKIYKPEDAFPKPTNATIFEITEDADGKVDVGSTFKADPTCPTCAGEAQKALTAALENMKAKHGGKIDPKKNVIEGSDFNINAGLAYQNMSLGEALAAMAKGYNSLVENAKVPVEVWQPNKAFPVKDNWGVITGGVDGVANELTDKAQLVGVALTIISNPKKTATDFVNFAQTMDWQKAQDFAINVGEGLINYDANEFAQGGVYAGHATGKVGGSLAMNATTLLAIVADVPKALKKGSEFLDNWKRTIDLSKVRKINGQMPQNATLFAGKKYSFDVDNNPKFIEGVSQAKKTRLDALHIKYPNGVDFDEFGFPRFEPYTETVNGKLGKIEVQTIGNRNVDFAEGDRLMGINEQYRIDNQLVWHHVEDTKTLILVPKDIHAEVKHTGGIAVFKNDINLDD